MDAGDRRSEVRLAELVAALSLATDLGLGQPQEHVLRQTVIARRLAAAAGLSDERQAAVFYVSLLAWVGCVADSHELATWFGDDQRLRADSYQVDKTRASMLRFALGHVGEGAGPVRRLTMIGRFLAGGPDRAGRSATDAAAALRAEAVAGRLDGETVNAVLAAAEHRVRHRPALPCDLSPREAEILVLLASGLSNKQMAEHLSVSARTVSSHVEHVYAKIGVSTRGAAAMFAMRHGLADSRADG